MATPVTTVASGGLAVVEVTAFGLAVTEAGTYGRAVTKVTGGKPGLGVTFVSATGGPAVTYATFDGTPSTAFITMSNGNLTATKNTSANSGAVHSTAAKSSGKYYFEITNTIKSVGTAHALGLSLLSTSDGNVASGVTTVTTVPATNTLIFSNSIDQGKNLGTGAAGNVYGFAIDLTGRLAWIRRAGGNWNGDAAANPATGTNGVVVGAGSFAPVVYLSTSTTLFDSITANFGASAFTGAVPSGFTAGWPA